MRYRTTAPLLLICLWAASAVFAASQRNEVILAMSQFKISFSKEGKKIYTPGHGKVWVLHPDEGWRKDVIPNRYSKAVHNAKPFDIDFDGRNELVVVGGTAATILAYKFDAGQWRERVIWKPDLLRVRDIEFGDVDGDGQVEFVVATHDRGVIAVFDYVDGQWRGQEVYRTADVRYVHEIEIGDVDGDGVPEFFANPSMPNVAVGLRQPGKVLMFKWNGKQYVKTVVEDFHDTHAKELLVADLYHDGRPRLVVAAEGIARKRGKGMVELLRPTELREHTWRNGRHTVRIIGTIDDVQCRSLAFGDVDNDGQGEIVAGCKSAGLFLFDRVSPTRWRRVCIDPKSTAAVHAVCVADVDGDGRNEILSASDDTDSLDLYKRTAKGWQKRTVAQLPKDDWVWTIAWGDADNR